MDAKIVVLLVLSSVMINGWRNEKRVDEDLPRLYRNRQNQPVNVESRRRTTTQSSEEMYSKPLKRISSSAEGSRESDRVIEVAVDPKPIHLKINSTARTTHQKPENKSVKASFLKDVIVELGNEFLARQISEDFVFGQYIGYAIRNLTNVDKLKLQHDILGLVIKYQTSDKKKFDVINAKANEKTNFDDSNDIKHTTRSSAKPSQDSEDNWLDFNTLTN